jgi:hypothetical protein
VGPQPDRRGSGLHRSALALIGLVIVVGANSWIAAIPLGAEPPSPVSVPALVITVNGLRAGLDAVVTVTGPDGYQSAVIGTEVLGPLPVGRYTVTAAPVVDAGGTYWPVPTNWPHNWPESVDVSTTDQSRVTVNYLDYVSHNVRVVPLGATESLGAEGRQEELDIVSQSAHETYRHGEILVSEPTPVVPDGYIVKVVKVEPSPGSTLEALEVHAVPLAEAVPEATVDEHADLTVYNSTFQSKDLSCSSGGAITLSAELHVTPSFTLKAKWGFRKHRSAELDAELNEDTSSQIVSGAHLQCDVPAVDLGPSVPLAPHGIVVFLIGPVPVVIGATLGVVAEGSVDVNASFRASVEQRAALAIHLFLRSAKDERGVEVTRFFEVPDGSVTAGVLGSAEVAIVPELRVRLYGLAGPTAGVRLSAKLDVGHDQRSLSVCATLHGHLHVHGFKKVLPWKGELHCMEVARWLSD